MADSDYKGKLLRLFREIMLLHRSPFGLTINELAEKCGVSYRTIYRDMDVLEQVGFIPEEIEKGKYVIRGLDSETKKFEKNLQFSAEEAAILNRAVSGISESHPVKKGIMEKLRTFSGMEDVLQVIVKSDISRNTEYLARAVREKKQVQFYNYHSSNSQTVRTRRVEPYAFTRDGVFVKGFELDSRLNKTYKIERIQEVMLEDKPWEFEKRHETNQEEDIFGIANGEPYMVKLKLSMRAAQLLREEYPLSQPHLYKEGAKTWTFEAKVNSFIGIGRFIMGLIDEIEVIKPKSLKDYLNEKIEKRIL